MSEPAAKQRQMIDLNEFERRLSRPSAPQRGNEDPLAELARLVGATEDRYNAMFQARPAESRAPAQPRTDSPPAYSRPSIDRTRIEPVAPAAARGPRLGGDFAAIEAGLRGAVAPDLYSEPDPDVEDEAWLDTPYIPPSELAIEPPRSRLPLYATAAVIFFGMAGIGGSFALKHHVVAPRDIAMIKAAPGPTKIRASATADVAQPGQDASILDKSSQPAPVKVVNRTEEPVDLGSTPPQTSASSMQVASNGAAVVPVPLPPAESGDGQGTSAAQAESQSQSFGLAGMIQPKKVKTISVRPDGTIISDGGQATTASDPSTASTGPMTDGVETGSVAPPQATMAMPPTMPGNANADTNAEQNGDKAAERSGDADSSTKPKPSSPKPFKLADRETDPGDDASASEPRSGGFAVQLAAPASEAEARQSMARLQRKFASELAGHHLKYHLAKVAGKTVFRVRVAGMSREAAASLCQKLQGKGGNCFVAKD